MNSRKYHRSSRNWNSGRLTNPYHIPAGESLEPSAAAVAYHVDVSSAM